MNIILIALAAAGVTFVLFAVFAGGQRYVEEDRLDHLENLNRQRSRHGRNN